jgi:hypothetical protein
MAVTVADIIDRLLRDFLTPPDKQPAQTRLDGAIDNAVTSITLVDDVLTQEEEDAIGRGAILEIGRELFRVTIPDAFPILTVATRGSVLGTSAAAHADGDPVIVAGASQGFVPRQAVFEAVADAIVDLYPDLFAVVTANHNSQTSLIEVLATVEEIVRYRYRSTDADSSVTRYVEGAVELQEDHHTDVASSGKAIQLIGVPTGRTGYLTSKSSFSRPADETYDLDTNSIDTSWHRLIVFDALVTLFAAADLTAEQQTYLTDAVQAQGFPVGSGESIDRSLIRVYEYLLTRAKKRLNQQYPMKVERSQVAMPT